MPIKRGTKLDTDEAVVAARGRLGAALRFLDEDAAADAARELTQARRAEAPRGEGGRRLARARGRIVVTQRRQPWTTAEIRALCARESLISVETFGLLLGRGRTSATEIVRANPQLRLVLYPEATRSGKYRTDGRGWFVKTDELLRWLGLDPIQQHTEPGTEPGSVTASTEVKPDAYGNSRPLRVAH